MLKIKYFFGPERDLKLKCLKINYFTNQVPD